MGIVLGPTAPQDGDDETISPRTSSRSLLAADAAGNARRILVDSSRALLVHTVSSDTGSATETTQLAVKADLDEIKLDTDNLDAPISGVAKAATQTDGTQKTQVTNFPATQVVTEANLDKNFGTWGYAAGTTGTPTIGAGKRVVGISCHSLTGGSFTINGGDTITVPANVAVNINPLGNLTNPTLVFTGTDTFFVEFVS